MKIIIVFILFIALFPSCQKNIQVEAPTPIEVAENRNNISYGSDPLQKMDIYLPAKRSSDSTRTIIMVHGGAWSSGDKGDFQPYVPVLQQRFKDYAIANINYRLATLTANHFPVQEEDMKAAVDFLLKNSSAYHISPNFILLGASSGGHQVTLQAYKYPQPKIRAVIDFFAPVNMISMYQSAAPGSINQLAIQSLVGGSPDTNPNGYQQSSPLTFVSPLSPPTIILHGGMDALVNISQSVALKNKLDSMGVPSQLVVYPAEGHTIWPDAVMKDAFDRIESFIKANVH